MYSSQSCFAPLPSQGCFGYSAALPERNFSHQSLTPPEPVPPWPLILRGPVGAEFLSPEFDPREPLPSLLLITARVAECAACAICHLMVLCRRCWAVNVRVMLLLPRPPL